MAKKRSTLKPLRVLFIGNSYSAHNDLTGMIARLAKDAGQEMSCRLISAGGASLRRHWNAGEAKRAIESGEFDVVVLQEQSTLPIKNAARMHENVRLFDEVIRKAGAKTFLYMTWARKHSPGSQKQITDAYESIGKEIDATVVPVGRAWEKLRAKHASPELYDKDQSHPTLAGSYLAACVFARTLSDTISLEAAQSIDGLSPSDEAAIRKFVR